MRPIDFQACPASLDRAKQALGYKISSPGLCDGAAVTLASVRRMHEPEPLAPTASAGQPPAFLCTFQKDCGEQVEAEWTAVFSSGSFEIIEKPSKRKRGLEDDKSEEQELISAKKPSVRASPAAARAGEFAEGSKEGGKTAGGKASPVKREASAEAVPGSDADKELAYLSRFNASAADAEHRAGQIKRVAVTNFMCHHNMEVRFNKNVNFISGPNGSGKSAILQALQFCLGVAACKAGRQTANRHYVRNGAREATAQVTIWNTGAERIVLLDAHKRDRFGPWITVVRTLTPDGRSTARLLNAKDEPTRLCESDTWNKNIQMVLQRLCVNAANPSIVLTQDHARGFLSGERVDSTLYRLFSESLGMDETQLHLRDAKAYIDKQKKEIGEIELERENMVRVLQDTQKRQEQAANAVGLDNLADALEEQAAWAPVWQKDREVKELKQQLLEAPARMEKLHEKDRVVKKSLEEAEKKLSEYGHLRESFQRQLEQGTHSYTEVYDKFKKLNGEKNEIQRKLRSAQEDLKDETEALQLAKQQAAEARSAEEVSAAREALDDWHKAREAALDKIQEVNGLKTQAMQAVYQAKECVAKATDVSSRAGYAQEELNRHVQQGRRDLASLQGADIDVDMVKFFPPAVRLRDLIQQNRSRFHRPPIGPIGAFLTISENKFSATVVGALQRLLQSYVVHDRADFYTLRSLLNQARNGHWAPNIYITSFDIPQHTIRPDQLPPGELTNVLSIVKVKPDAPNAHTLMNVLVDQGSAEALVLAEDEDAGKRLLRNPAAWRNINAVWCNQERDGPLQLTRTRGGCESIWPWKFARPEPLLSQDHSALLESRKRRLEEQERNLEEAQAHALQCVNGVHTAQAELATATARNQQLSTELERTRKHLANLEGNKPEVPTGSNVEAADQHVEELQAEVARLQAEFEIQQQQMEEASAVARAAYQEKEAAMAETNRLKSEIDKSFENNKNSEIAQKTLEAEIASIQQKLEMAAAASSKLEDVIAEAENDLEPLVEEAKEKCSREEAEDEQALLRKLLPEVLGQQLKRRKLTLDDVLSDAHQLSELSKILRNKVKQSVKSARSKDSDTIIPESIVDELSFEEKTLQVQLEELKKRTGGVSELVKMQGRSFRRRRERFMELRDSSCNCINEEFRRKVRTGRNWQGRLAVDHEEERLRLHVITSKGGPGKPQKATKDLKSLSGGERSFTTVSFVLSLGKEVCTPFFAMDEFDVFMDAVTRKISLAAILRFAWEMRDVQFILLSPLDMAVVEQARAYVNEELRQNAQGEPVVEMPREFVQTLAMQPPRAGAQAHYHS